MRTRLAPYPGTRARHQWDLPGADPERPGGVVVVDERGGVVVVDVRTCPGEAAVTAGRAAVTGGLVTTDPPAPEPAPAVVDVEVLAGRPKVGVAWCWADAGRVTAGVV